MRGLTISPKCGYPQYDDYTEMVKSGKCNELFPSGKLEALGVELNGKRPISWRLSLTSRMSIHINFRRLSLSLFPHELPCRPWASLSICVTA